MMSLHMGAAGSVAEGKAMAVYLLEQQIPTEAMRAAAYYGQTPGIEDAIAAGYGAAPLLRTDIDPALADALGLTRGQAIGVDQLSQILSGNRADGTALPVQHQHRDVRAYGKDDDGDGKLRHRVAYLDLTLSAPKHVSLGWSFAKTEAERNALLQAHRTARDETLRYVEQQIIRSRLGDGGSLGHERARAAWITVDHYTARPTQERICTDPTTGETYTELTSAKVAGDPALHSHCLVPNLIRTESGRYTAIDTAAFHGRIHEFGAIYQGILERELIKLNVKAEIDPRTNTVRLPAIPDMAVDEFSKRSREGEAAARKRAAQEGRDWDAMTPEQQATFKKAGTHATRLDKETNTPDWDAWRQQAERIGWTHSTVIEADPLPVRSRAERFVDADRLGLEFLSDMLARRAVLDQGEVRLAIARGFIAAGGLESAADIGLMAWHWAHSTVTQDGQETRLIWKEVEPGKIKLTTELHRDQEAEFIALAREAAADRRHALTSAEIAAAVERSGFSYRGRHGNQQRAAIETAGTEGGLSVVLGVAGAGKTTGVLSPLVDAWKARGLEEWGTAQAWRQAKDLRSAGIHNLRIRALDPFLTAARDGRIKLTSNTVVVLDEVGRIGTVQVLDLLRLRQQQGFKLVLAGDDEQGQSIQAGPVIDLLRRALGEERIPKILTTIRQDAENERALANMFRRGEVAEAIKIKRADGTAELVPGGYRDAIARVADLYMERRQATRDRSNYRITISAPTHADAREIARLVRERRRDIGEVGSDLASVAVTDGSGVGSTLDLAAGDRVRLFVQTRGIFVDDQGRRKSAFVGDNGTVLDVLGVNPKEGLQLRGESGKVAFVPWTALRDRNGTDRLMLGSGEVLTIDSSQGMTSHEHIDALPAGSAAVNGYKAYVAASRHRIRHYLIGSMGAELQEVKARRMSGLPRLSPQEAEGEAWATLVTNLRKRPKKDSALDLLEQATVNRRATAQSLQRALLRHETRELAGKQATTLRQRQANKAVRQALPRIAEGLAAMAAQQAATVRRTGDIAPSRATGERQYRRIKISEIEARQQFADALHRHGLRLKTLPEMDGQIHYVPVEGNRGRETSGAYKGFYDDDRPPSGAIYNWKQGGFVGTWTAQGETIPISAEDHAERMARAAEKAAAQEQERIEREAAGARTAADLIAGARPADGSHPYLQQKGVDAHGIHVANPGQTVSIKGSDGTTREHSIAGRLLVPLRNADGEIRNVQMIAADGTKLYLQGAQKIGTFHILGRWTGEAVGIAEGYATAATGHRVMDMPVAMALDTSNLTAVALALRQASPDGPVFMLADNDHHLPMRNPPRPNQGMEKAEKAAEAAGATVLLAPELPERAIVGRGTDWNDYAARRGTQAVKAAIGAQMGKTALLRPVETQRAAMSQGMGA